MFDVVSFAAFMSQSGRLKGNPEAADSLYRLCKRYSAGHYSEAGSPSVGRFGDSSWMHAKSSATIVVQPPRKRQPSANADFFVTRAPPIRALRPDKSGGQVSEGVHSESVRRLDA
jgi:hypothetical protein